MLKHKKFLSILLVLPFLSLASCAKPKEPYPVHRYSKEKDVVNTHLVVEGELTKDEYQTNKAEVLNLEGLIIKIDGVTKDLSNDRKNKDNFTEAGFFVCSNETYPSNSIIESNYKATTNVESHKFTFYIACTITINNEKEIYVSQSFSVTIKNASAIKPWVWYTVTAVVIFGVVAMVFFTRRYKAKKEGKI